MSEEKNIKNIIKKFKSIIGIVVLGAFGSGFWDVAVKPSGLFLLDHTFRFFAETFSSYRNSLYLEAARGFHEYSSVFVHSIILLIPPALYIILLLRHPMRKENDSGIIKDKVGKFLRSKKGFKLILIITAGAIINSVAYSVRISYVNSTITYFNQSIALIEPFISTNEIKILKAAFAGMKSSNDFKRIDEQIRLKAKKFNVRLPDTDSNIY